MEKKLKEEKQIVQQLLTQIKMHKCGGCLKSSSIQTAVCGAPDCVQIRKCQNLTIPAQSNLFSHCKFAEPHAGETV